VAYGLPVIILRQSTLIQSLCRGGVERERHPEKEEE
jgi:hypothetical protein